MSEESGIGCRKMHLTSTFFAEILTAPVGRVWRFTHFYSVAPLLEKWFACFPTSGDGLRFPILSFITRQASTAFLCESFPCFLIFLF